MHNTIGIFENRRITDGARKKIGFKASIKHALGYIAGAKKSTAIIDISSPKFYRRQSGDNLNYCLSFNSERSNREYGLEASIVTPDEQELKSICTFICCMQEMQIVNMTVGDFDRVASVVSKEALDAMERWRTYFAGNIRCKDRLIFSFAVSLGITQDDSIRELLDCALSLKKFKATKLNEIITNWRSTC